MGRFPEVYHLISNLLNISRLRTGLKNAIIYSYAFSLSWNLSSTRYTINNGKGMKKNCSVQVIKEEFTKGKHKHIIKGFPKLSFYFLEIMYTQHLRDWIKSKKMFKRLGLNAKFNYWIFSKASWIRGKRKISKASYCWFQDLVSY